MLRFKQQFVIPASIPENLAFVVGHYLLAADFRSVHAIRIQQNEFYLRFKQNAYLYFGLFHNGISLKLEFLDFRSHIFSLIRCRTLWKSVAERHTSLNICATSSAVIFKKSFSTGVIKTPPKSTDAGLLNRLASPSAV